MGTEEIVLSDEDLEGLNWEKQDGVTCAEFENQGRRFRISVQHGKTSCRECDSCCKSTGEFRIRRVPNHCLASKIRAARLPDSGCGGKNARIYSNPYKVVQIGLAESSPANSVGPIQPSLF